MEERQKMYKVYVMVWGVKKRCRVSKRHVLNMGYIPYNDGVYDKEALTQKAKDFVSTNLKKVEEAPVLNLSYVEVGYDNGFRSEMWQAHSPNSVNWKVLSGLENQLT
jgi:hypothetical protein